MTNLEATILHVVRVRPRSHGLVIGRAIEEILQKPVGLGTVYKTLHRLERDAFLTSQWGDATDDDGGRRRYYTITGLGATALNDFSRSLARISRVLAPRRA